MNVWAPGRVNLIGEHTDYSGGLVLPIAIQLGLTLEVEPHGPQVVAQSDAFGATQPIEPDGSGTATQGWGRFAQAVARELNDLGRAPVGMKATISSSLPAGAGLSSSAALEVGLAIALCAVAEFELEPFELAAACCRAEERAVGVPCGILDQAACVLGERDAAILLDCASLGHGLLEVPPDAGFLIIDSGIRRELEHTGYSQRRQELETALAQLGAASPRELTIDQLDLSDPLSRRRLRHVITENARVEQFAEAFASDDLLAAGALLSASHASLRDDYEVSLPELDALAAAAEECGALGARLMGGGFGGSILALVEAPRAVEIAERIRQTNQSRRLPITVRASEGAGVRPGAQIELAC
ncbi:MAG TPA: galactokinase family protein [Gaiellaceae bacterium]|nr:galactokinase family protein [Gaiellaceae bacterium]